ncbi:DUF6705 family protein [Chryseobacterium indoltheticum]|uniref:DUF6705 domain-containing protein n=1 Tax=Chryseobacterium indoltheticum TaxID=254 RepID=A0A381FHX1_9FLAO|nr:DUF6705 family protein [Chryseobacterium indoltheticum]SUX46137.1 Uncharacterised protein [Chryseobacterium indoltheticum]
MKLYLYKIIFILVFIPNCLYQAQSKPNIGEPTLIPCSSYIQDDSIDRFIGTWEGNNNGKTLKLILKKEKIRDPNTGICYDLIFGFHKLIENGVETENSVQFDNTNYLNGKSTILGTTNTNNNSHLHLSVTHLSKNKNINIIISYIDSEHLKIDASKNFEGIKVNEPGKPPYDYSIAIPSDFTLTKQ